MKGKGDAQPTIPSHVSGRIKDNFSKATRELQESDREGFNHLQCVPLFLVFRRVGECISLDLFRHQCVEVGQLYGR